MWLIFEIVARIFVILNVMTIIKNINAEQFLKGETNL